MLNKVMLIGNVGRDPEVKHMPSGDNEVAKFSLAVSRSWKNRDGDKQEETTWFNCECWGKLSSAVVMPYVGKGDRLYVEGRFQVDEYEKDGQTQRYTKVVVETLKMLGSKDRGQRSDNSSSGSHTVTATTAEPASGDKPKDDEIPF